MRTVLPMLLVAGAMYALVRVTALAVPGNALLRLLAEVAAGVVSYVLLSALFRLEEPSMRWSHWPGASSSANRPAARAGRHCRPGAGKTSAGSISGGRFCCGAVPFCSPVSVWRAVRRFARRMRCPGLAALAVAAARAAPSACAAPLPVRRRPSGRWCRGGRPVRWRPAIRVRSRRGRPKRGR